MPTLILTPRQTPDAQALWRAAIERGWAVDRLAGWRVPDTIREIEEPIIYVESLMGPMIAESLGLRLHEPPMDWLPRLPEKYRRRTVELMTVGAARTIMKPAFMKPPNTKGLPARVRRGDELPIDLPDDDPILVAEVVAWDVEFRCVIQDRSLSTFSIYLRRGELQRDSGFVHDPIEEAELRQFVDRLVNDPGIELPQGAIVDVGVIHDRGWAVVEQNMIWGSGLYGCDPNAFLDALALQTLHGTAQRSVG